MKRILILPLLLLTGSLVAQNRPEEKAGWMLGAQSYSFRLFPFSEALRKIDSCGLKYVEAFPGQTIGGGIDGKLDFKMDQATRDAVKKMLRDKGLTLTAYGVVNAKTEDEWRQIFAFAKDMGIRNINTEPNKDQMPYIIRMAEENKINVAIHNHPKPTRYWHPDSVLAVIGNSKYVGACADIGHWVRSGLDPVECLKRYEGHILGLHFKDVKKDTPDWNAGAGKYHDVVWGTGDCNIPGVLAELKRQKFKGPISAEYEYHWENNAPEIFQSAQSFRQIYSKK